MGISIVSHKPQHHTESYTLKIQDIEAHKPQHSLCTQLHRNLCRNLIIKVDLEELKQQQQQQQNMLTCLQKQQVGWPIKDKPVRDAILILVFTFVLSKELNNTYSFCILPRNPEITGTKTL